MPEFKSVDEILDFAIEREQEAVEFYTDIAKRAKSPAAREAFEMYANEERGHKAKLEKVKAGRKLLSAEKKLQDLKIGDYLVEGEFTEDIDYQDILILAMKREKAAYKLYMDMAARVDDPEVKDLLIGLANEEAKHKLRFEVEYDENVLTEN